MDLTTLLILLGTVVALAAVIVLVRAASAPSTFAVSRTLTIEAPAASIYPHIAELRAMNVWNPFAHLDPDAKVSYSGSQAGPGSRHDWDGNARAGSGHIEVVDAQPDQSVRMRLVMRKPMRADNTVVFKLTPRGPSTTEVTWTMSGHSSFGTRLVCMFYDMDRMVGGTFEEGLARLRHVVATGRVA